MEELPFTFRRPSKMHLKGEGGRGGGRNLALPK